MLFLIEANKFIMAAKNTYEGQTIVSGDGKSSDFCLRKGKVRNREDRQPLTLLGAF